MNRLSLLTCTLLLLLCACTQSITPASTPAASVNTPPTLTASASLKEQFTQQLTARYLEWEPTPPPTNPGLAAHKFSKDKYLFEQFVDLLSDPDTQAFSLEELQEILQSVGVGGGVFYEGSDPDYVLANYGGIYYPGGHNYTLPGIYVFSRTGELWDISAGIIGAHDRIYLAYTEAMEDGEISLSTTDKIRTLDNGWVFAVDLTSNSGSGSIDYAVWHIRQMDDQWQVEELLRVNWDTVAAPSVPFIKFDDGYRHLTVSYLGYADTLPCQFSEQILEEYYINPFYEYTTIFEWQNEMYIQTDQWEEAISMRMSKRDDYRSAAAQNCYDWQEYCED